MKKGRTKREVQEKKRFNKDWTSTTHIYVYEGKTVIAKRPSITWRASIRALIGHILQCLLKRILSLSQPIFSPPSPQNSLISSRTLLCENEPPTAHCTRHWERSSRLLQQFFLCNPTIWSLNCPKQQWWQLQQQWYNEIIKASKKNTTTIRNITN